jgi:hypothetical protein
MWGRIILQGSSHLQIGFLSTLISQFPVAFIQRVVRPLWSSSSYVTVPCSLQDEHTFVNVTRLCDIESPMRVNYYMEMVLKREISGSQELTSITPDFEKISDGFQIDTNLFHEWSA